jgi:hypothetical protein
MLFQSYVQDTKTDIYIALKVLEKRLDKCECHNLLLFPEKKKKLKLSTETISAHHVSLLDGGPIANWHPPQTKVVHISILERLVNFFIYLYRTLMAVAMITVQTLSLSALGSVAQQVNIMFCCKGQDPDPVPDVRIRIQSKRSGSATLEIPVAIKSY